MPDLEPVYPAPSPSRQEPWIARSDRFALELIRAWARFDPETLGRLGFEDADENVTRFTPERSAEQAAALAGVDASLAVHLAAEDDPEVRFDLEVLLDVVRRDAERHRLEACFLRPYFQPARTVYEGLQALLNDDVAPERRDAARVRLLRYAGLADGFAPLAVQAEEAVRAGLGDGTRLAPVREVVDGDLATSRRLAGGIRELLAAAGLADWEKAWETLRAQLDAYDAFVRAEVLSRSREDFRLPPELYASYLAAAGVDMAPEELAGRSRVAFWETENEIRVLAPQVARERGLKDTDYREVIRELRREQIAPSSLVDHYLRRLDALEELIERHAVVSLPGRRVRMRMANAVEAAAYPFPHMRPPRLIGNRGEPAELVVPVSVPGSGGEELAFDDLSFKAASWSLALHEGRPGHELHFAAVLSRGHSLARSFCGFTPAWLEGWAVYMESELRPYLPRDAQLVLLQQRLVRAARTWLGPALQRGTIRRAEAADWFRRGASISEAAARREIARVTVHQPGYAPVYFAGYSRLAELRCEVAQRLGAEFDRRSYHDLLLSQGLVPLTFLHRRVLEVG